MQRGKPQTIIPHLTGAPRDWAGLSITVMVVSVSLSGVSASYSGIDGAREEREIGSDQHMSHMPLDPSHPISSYPLDPIPAEQR